MSTTPHHDPFAQLGRIVVGDQPLPSILEQVVRIANGLMPSDTEASLTLLEHDGPVTVAFTGDTAIALDERQYDAERGPCLTAAATGEPILITDSRTDHRWPQYAEAAVDSGVYSSLSMPLPLERELAGALNFFARVPDAFNADSITLAESFSDHAAVAIANARLYQATAAATEQMRKKMASWAVIEQAKGIIMRECRCTSDDAFRALVQISQEDRCELRDIATRLIERATASG